MPTLNRVIALSLVAGCGKSESPPVEESRPAAPPPPPALVDVPRPASVPDEWQRRLDEMAGVFDRYATDALAAAGDCNKVAAALRKVTADHGSVIALYSETTRQLDAAGIAWLDKRYQPRMQGNYQRIGHALAPCLAATPEIGYALAESPLPKKW